MPPAERCRKYVQRHESLVQYEDVQRDVYEYGIERHVIAGRSDEAKRPQPDALKVTVILSFLDVDGVWHCHARQQ